MAALAEYRNRDIKDAAQRRGITLTLYDARTLRLAELTLHRWAEEVCNGTIQRPWAERETYLGRFSNDPVRPDYTSANSPGQGKQSGWLAVPDRETGALRRVAKLCDRLGLHYYHQGDPRGCSLYIDSEPIPRDDYTRAVACSSR